MTLTKEQQEQLVEAARPLVAWLAENCHPHCMAHVDQGGVELSEIVAADKTLATTPSDR